MCPLFFSNEKVSCILVNTEKGKKYIDELLENKFIEAENRPVEEPIKGDSQLRHPSVKSFSRRLWEKVTMGILLMSLNMFIEYRNFGNVFLGYVICLNGYLEKR